MIFLCFIFFCLSSILDKYFFVCIFNDIKIFHIICYTYTEIFMQPSRCCSSSTYHDAPIAEQYKLK